MIPSTYFGARVFQRCTQPVLSPYATEMRTALHASLERNGLTSPYACVHWRVGDELAVKDGTDEMANATLLAATLQALLSKHGLLPCRANSGGAHHRGSCDGAVRSLLVLTEPASNPLLPTFRTHMDALGLPVVLPFDVYSAEPKTYTGSVVNFDVTFAEKDICSQAALFFGHWRSSYAEHIYGLAKARKTVAILGTSGNAIWGTRNYMSATKYIT